MGVQVTMSASVGPGPGDGPPPKGQAAAARAAFTSFVAATRAVVEARLAGWLEARVAEAGTHGPAVVAVADALRQLALRGGKRMRAVLLAAGYVAAGRGDPADVAPAGAALELLQAYLLTHDDWMDGDDVRRGGPSVPAMMRAHFGPLGAASEGVSAASAGAVLAGDLAASWALSAMLELSLPPARVLGALGELARVEEEVVLGQVLDVEGAARGRSAVEAIYALKTASYTVRGPVIIGARLGGADERQEAALRAFAEPLGVAFQLRDDLLGATGDPGRTGKPRGGDLRKGKRTALVLEAMRDARASQVLGRVLGQREAGEDEVAEALAVLGESGAIGRVEARIAALVADARAALARAPLAPEGRELLTQAIEALTERDR